MNRVFKMLCWAALFFVARIYLAEGNSTMPFAGAEFLTGFGYSHLKFTSPNYHVIPLYVDFDYDLKDLAQKHKINTPGLLQFMIEPFVSYIDSPDKNAEIGNNFGIKFGFGSDKARWQPYAKASVGFIYISQHMERLSTQFDFNEYAALGTHYFIRKDTALSFEYRIRHVSNADIKKPNIGFNTHYALFGIAYFF